MKKIASAFLAAAALIAPCRSITVDWGAQDTAVLGLLDGSLALNGSLVRLGYFTISDAQIQAFAAANDMLSLDSAFQQFASSTVGNGFGSSDGIWSASNVNPNAAFTGNRIYYWTLNAPTLGAATQWGVYKLPSTFPSDTPVPGSIVTDINQVPVNSTGLIVGSFSAGGAPSPFGGADLYKMVPEPTSASLLFFGLIGLGFRRRRNS